MRTETLYREELHAHLTLWPVFSAPAERATKTSQDTIFLFLATGNFSLKWLHVLDFCCSSQGLVQNIISVSTSVCMQWMKLTHV